MKTGKAPYIPLADLDATLAAQTGLHASRNNAILLLSHYLGLRAKELASLRIGDVYDPRTGELRDVVRLMAHMTKGAKFREVFLVNERARTALSEYLKTRSVRHADAPLFQSQKGGAFSPNTLQQLASKMYSKAGVPGSSHSGRRTFATRLIESGVDIFSLKDMMGHSGISTTEKYLQSNPSRLRKFAGLLA